MSVSKKIISLAGNMIDYLPGIPFGMGEELLKVAGVRVWEYLGHAFNDFLRISLRQATEVLSGFISDIMSVTLKMVRIFFHSSNKTPADASECRRLMVCIELPPGLRIIWVITSYLNP